MVKVGPFHLGGATNQRALNCEPPLLGSASGTGPDRSLPAEVPSCPHEFPSPEGCVNTALLGFTTVPDVQHVVAAGVWSPPLAEAYSHH